MLDQTTVNDVAAMIEQGEGGGLVAIAKAKNLNIKELSAALKEKGIVLRSGRKDATTDVPQAPDPQAQGQNAKPSPTKRKDRVMMPSLFDQVF